MSEINWDSKEFNSIPINKREILKSITKEASGITPEASLVYLTKLNSTLKKHNLSLTNSEKEIIINALFKNMSEKDKSKFALLRTLLTK